MIDLETQLEAAGAHSMARWGINFKFISKLSVVNFKFISKLSVSQNCLNLNLARIIFRGGESYR